MSDFGQELLICLATLEGLNAFSRLELLRQIKINANDSTQREVVTPQDKRTSLVDAILEKLDLFADPLGQKSDRTTPGNGWLSCQCHSYPSLAAYFAYWFFSIRLTPNSPATPTLQAFERSEAVPCHICSLSVCDLEHSCCQKLNNLVRIDAGAARKLRFHPSGDFSPQTLEIAVA
jgi:hypothetical protein